MNLTLDVNYAFAKYSHARSLTTSNLSYKSHQFFQYQCSNITSSKHSTDRSHSFKPSTLKGGEGRCKTQDGQDYTKNKNTKMPWRGRKS